MEELYALIETTIKESGYQKPINGHEIYEEISDEIEGKENGTYLFLSKKSDTLLFEYKIEIYDDTFNLDYLHITDQDTEYHIDFNK